MATQSDPDSSTQNRLTLSNSAHVRKVHRRFSRVPVPAPKLPETPWSAYFIFRNSLETFRAQAATDFQSGQIGKALGALELMRHHLESCRVIPVPVMSEDLRKIEK